MPEKNDIDVKKIAELARIELDENKIDQLQSEMQTIIEYVDHLSDLDLEGIEPTAHASPMSNVMRNDTKHSSLKRSKMLENAPETIDEELLEVPKVLPGEGMS